MVSRREVLARAGHIAPSATPMKVPIMRAQSLLLAATLVLAGSASASAQVIPERKPTGPVRAQFDIGIAVAQPLGAFRQYVKIGGGLEGSFIWNLTRDGAWGVRFDGGFLNYGRETKRTRFSNTVGDRIRVDVNTTNNIGMLGVGPHLQVPHGAIRPYLHGLVGFSYFFTESSVEGVDDELDFARTTNFSDGTFTYGGGGGLLIPLRVKSAPVSINLGARFLHNGETSYLREGSITDHPDGTITIAPLKSEVELMVYHLGVNIGIR
jgi:hypothetical protein